MKIGLFLPSLPGLSLLSLHHCCLATYLCRYFHSFTVTLHRKSFTLTFFLKTIIFDFSTLSSSPRCFKFHLSLLIIPFVYSSVFANRARSSTYTRTNYFLLPTTAPLKVRPPVIYFMTAQSGAQRASLP